nr:peroxisomal ABC transporter 1 [Tanacetum cinerariifolium]
MAASDDPHLSQFCPDFFRVSIHGDVGCGKTVVAFLACMEVIDSYQVPTVLDKQGAQLLVVAVLVLSRTWISDRITSLNGMIVKYVLELDKAAFVRLIGVSVLQSAASSFFVPSLRHLTARLALG